MRRTTWASCALTLFAGVFLAAGAAAQCPVTDFDATGIIRDAAGAPVPCCEVLVTVSSRAGGVTSQALVTTDANGRYVATLQCMECPPPLDDQTLEVESLCCQGSSGFIDISGCRDPAGDPLQLVDVPDITCIDTPRAGNSLRGRIACRDQGFIEPVPNCSVLITDDAGNSHVTTTDINGDWQACWDCNPSISQYLVQAQCCGVARFLSAPSGCAQDVNVGTMLCQACPNPPCPTGETEVLGRLVCAGFGGPEPVEGCEVEIVASGCGSQVAYSAITQADGSFTACVACPASGDCTDWEVIASADCCGAFEVEPVVGCPPSVQTADLFCSPMLPCPGAPCPPNTTTIDGRVTCFDASGDHPLGGCEVLATGLGPCNVEVIARTDADGRYELCFPCIGCDGVEITALCCGASETRMLAGCPADMTVNLDCGSCVTPRPCEAPRGIQVLGQVKCDDPKSPDIAGCEVLVEGYDSTGMLIASAITTTDGSGHYAACLECGPNGLSSVLVTALCCASDQTRAVTGCPEVLEMDPLECGQCGPCPPEFTRLQGKVQCRGGDRRALAGCPIRLTVPTCADPVTYETTADDKGRYALCVPCPPCPVTSRVVTVEAVCCGATKTQKLKRDCKRSQSLKPLTCKPCP